VLSDEDLMTAVSKGDIKAFEEIVRRYQASVWRVAVRVIGDAAEAQDITQSVFLKILESASRYRVTALFKTYLYRIVTTTCIDHSRKRNPTTFNKTLDISDDESPSVSDIMITHENNEALRHAIDTLSLRYRSAIVLRYDAELSIRDIAGILKITEKAVERLLAHARNALYIRLKNKMN
jgi:RNA polymerase sigma-70 factor, ECF subfamily